MVTEALLEQYNQPVPRYTSYPTVPFWQEGLDADAWKSIFRDRFAAINQADGISLYLHLPYCESLCTYCGCNKKITTNHSVEEEYIRALLKEWESYRRLMGSQPVIREIHLGGGTPTFFSPRNLEWLISTLLKDSIIHPDHSFSIEGHPNNTTREHLQTLFDLGFRRISYGVQDNDPIVQFIINRIQPFENVARATEQAREIGFTSVNFDLIYGLPRQTIEGMTQTLEQCISLRPDRVAFYSYAHVPWTSRGQRLFDESDLPNAELKMNLYRLGKERFAQHGYVDIGMDHFSTREDELFIAREAGWLHRNFMGYTTQKSGLLLGLGVSSISDAYWGYAQNHKTIHDYLSAVNEGELAVTKGCLLSEEDARFRKYILDISCQGRTAFEAEDLETLAQYSFPKLRSLAADGLVEWDEEGAALTPLGHHFIRNVCSAFDLYLQRNKSKNEKPLFSKAI
ncbi:oxygen-independent coproporphyrinogen III oxidase [Flavihumibacter rivuli]|uniref:oxygen-independent coproporphyrinogen III oxidase n=1 Tax=Flavihumibacter rivuli TaxID=2838156 RepID=UPI001BDE7C9F|nr:oxygen-independent coproporphyrinogen III oxidase [Flavihumibacter rivuli]ULQ55048.1 oxygen-independent coproporphyrinogen III oxidase [Flavihumibacter rivuli]